MEWWPARRPLKNFNLSNQTLLPKKGDRIRDIAYLLNPISDGHEYYPKIDFRVLNPGFGYMDSMCIYHLQISYKKCMTFFMVPDEQCITFLKKCTIKKTTFIWEKIIILMDDSHSSEIRDLFSISNAPAKYFKIWYTNLWNLDFCLFFSCNIIFPPKSML